MTKYPGVTGKRLYKCLLRKGFIKVRQKGSHITIRHPNNKLIVATIPLPRGDIPNGTLDSIKRQLQLSREDFLEILQDC